MNYFWNLNQEQGWKEEMRGGRAGEDRTNSPSTWRRRWESARKVSVGGGGDGGGGFPPRRSTSTAESSSIASRISDHPRFAASSSSSSRSLPSSSSSFGSSPSPASFAPTAFAAASPPPSLSPHGPSSMALAVAAAASLSSLPVSVSTTMDWCLRKSSVFVGVTNHMAIASTQLLSLWSFAVCVLVLCQGECEVKMLKHRAASVGIEERFMNIY